MHCISSGFVYIVGVQDAFVGTCTYTTVEPNDAFLIKFSSGKYFKIYATNVPKIIFNIINKSNKNIYTILRFVCMYRNNLCFILCYIPIEYVCVNWCKNIIVFEQAILVRASRRRRRRVIWTRQTGNCANGNGRAFAQPLSFFLGFVLRVHFGGDAPETVINYVCRRKYRNDNKENFI